MIKKILALCLIVFVLCSCSKMPTELSSEENISTMSEIEYTQETETHNTDVLDNTDTETFTEEKKTSIDTGVTETEEHQKEHEKTDITVPTVSNPPKQEGSEDSTEESKDNSSECEPQIPPVQNATEEDCDEIAERLITLINGYRCSEGRNLTQMLSGLTKYAKYRSRQLVTNFAHDTLDERDAATTLKYGQYIDPSLYGMSGEPYYTANCGEAIAKAGYVGTVDYIAERFAVLLKNSSEHWSYVGADQYKYIAVGITKQSDMWYCCIAVAIENTDNL